MGYIGWLLICITEGILFSVCLVIVSNIRESRRTYLCGLFVLIEIATVWLLYRNNETVWLFFVHPYISFLIVDIADYIFVKRDKFEKFFLWPFYVIPAVSGFVLVWGWMFKIHAFRELFGILQK